MSEIAKKLIQQWNNLWEQGIADEKRNRIKSLLDDGNYIFFFMHKKQLFAAPEQSRVIFAKLKDKEDESEEWKKEAAFTASNLYQCVDGTENQTVFRDKDMDEIEVIPDKDKVEKLLVKHIESK